MKRLFWVILSIVIVLRGNELIPAHPNILESPCPQHDGVVLVGTRPVFL